MYLGKEPQFTQFPSKFFNGDGTAMTVSLDYSPPNEAALLVFISGVRQDTDAYNISGTSLTFTGTVPSGTNNVQVVHMGLAMDVGVPGDDTVTSAKIANDAVGSSEIANNAVGNSEMADDAVGVAELSATGTASATTFLRGDNSWQPIAEYDDSGLQDDIALIGFQVAANGSLAKYNLVDQTVDAFETEAGVDLSTSTGEHYSSSGNYYSGAQAADWFTGDRRASVSPTFPITVTSDMTWFTNGSNPLDINALVNGVSTYDAAGGNWFDSGQNGYIRFDHGAVPLVYTNSRWIYNVASGGTEGTYKWQGSDDAISWTDIGSSWTLSATNNGSINTDTHGVMTANTTAYRYYQATYVSGNNVNGSGRRMLMEFYGAGLAVDMVLVSNATTAESAPSKGDIVLTWTDGTGTATLGTDLTAEFSADNGSTWTAATLVDKGTTGSHNIASAHDITRTSTSGTSMRWRVKTLNQSATKETRIQAVSLGWS